MRVIVLYHPQGEHGGLVADYATEFQRFKNKTLELISLETPEGASFATLYGVNQYPAVIVWADDGSLLRLWEGLPMPMMDEVSYSMGDGHAVGMLGHTVAVPAPH